MRDAMIQPGQIRAREPDDTAQDWRLAVMSGACRQMTAALSRDDLPVNSPLPTLPDCATRPGKRPLRRPALTVQGKPG